MKSLLPLAIALSLMAGCSHRITRIDYTPGAPSGECDPVIKKMASLTDVPVKKIGSIKLGDTGFSTKCEETDAIRILKKEACAVGADIVNITDEKRTDFISSCYRVEADFLKFLDSSSRSKLASDEVFQDEAVEYRKDEDKDRKTGMIVGSIVGGLVAGLVFALLTSK